MELDLFEKKARAKRNLSIFFIAGIIGTIAFAYFIIIPGTNAEILRDALQEQVGLLEWLSVVGLFLFLILFLIYTFGSFALGVYFAVKHIPIALLIFTLGAFFIGAMIVGFFVSIFIVIRDLYYLCTLRNLERNLERDIELQEIANGAVRKDIELCATVSGKSKEMIIIEHILGEDRSKAREVMDAFNMTTEDASKQLSILESKERLKKLNQ